MIQSNIEFLREYTEKKNNKKVKHEFSKYARFFPYTANDSRATFEQGMERVIGEMVRQLSSVELSKSYNTDEIMNNLLEKITFEVDEIKPNFKEIFKNFIGADENRARIFHPYMYHFITLSENGEALREKELAEFIKCIFFEDLNAKHCFEKSKANNVFIQLLLDSMGDLIGKNYEEQYAADSETEFSKTSKKKAYKSKLPFLTEIFKNDFEYLATKKDGFIKELPLIISYYYFMYVCQLSMKLDQGFKADFSKICPLYWILDHESLSKSRMTNEVGYKQVINANKNLMSNVVQLAHINILSGVDYSRSLVELSNDLSNLDKDVLSSEIFQWTKEYIESFGVVDNTILDQGFDLNARQLLKKIRENLPNAPATKFPKPIDVIGKKFFLKSRGLYGNTLNLSQDLLLLLVGLSIKEERTLIKDVFLELEQRGLFLDRLSREEVVMLLDKLNLLDKKSDSGDAQYVKPVF